MANSFDIGNKPVASYTLTVELYMGSVIKGTSKKRLK